MGGRTHGKDNETVLKEISASHPHLLFDKFEYKNSSTKVTIGCNIHGYFEKYPNDMKNGRGGCPKCNKSFWRGHADFIKELNELHPNIKCLGEYKNSTTKLLFNCTLHNYSFTAQPYSLLAGHNSCPTCYSMKQIATRVSKGLIRNPDCIPEYEKYRKEVWKHSNRNYKIFMSEQTRDRHNHLDHILSIVDGFNNNVPPEVLGSVHNLRIISGQDNRRKSYKSDITVNQLLERYNQ